MYLRSQGSEGSYTYVFEISNTYVYLMYIGPCVIVLVEE